MLLEGIGKRYKIGGSWVLQDVHLVLQPGRVVRITGYNGSGKSTLLRIVAGIAEPTRGRVTQRPTTGYVPERFPPALPFTAGQYLRHHARIRGVSQQRGVDWLERFGAAGFAKTAMRELSKGTSQKVAITQALMSDPELLVLDEAWTGLDTDARAVLEEVVRERAAAGGCVVFVDHDPARLADSTDERWLVRGGALESVSAAALEILAEVARAGTGRTVIDVTGIPSDADLATRLPKAEASRDRDGGGYRIVVDEERSDDTLRRLLAIDVSVHIKTVLPARSDEEIA
jgi:ABC-type multidrug transport system ATPase subunit